MPPRTSTQQKDSKSEPSNDSVGRVALKAGGISKAWALTFHNYEAKHLDALRNLAGHQSVDYLVFQEEICPTTKTLHIQGAVILRRNYRLPGLQKISSKDFQWRQKYKNSTDFDLTHYCRKPVFHCSCSVCDNARSHPELQSEPEEYGERPVFQQGRRNDLIELKKMADEKKSTYSMYEAHFSTMVRYSRGIKDYAVHIPVKMADMYNPTVIYCWGPTTVGKSTYAKKYIFSKFADDWWLKEDGAWWFDGYQGQSAVLLDDWRPSWLEGVFTRHLMLLRDCPKTIPVKNSFIKWYPKLIVITADKPLDQYFFAEEYAQMSRRITSFVDATGWPEFVNPEPQRTVTSFDQL